MTAYVIMVVNGIGNSMVQPCNIEIKEHVNKLTKKCMDFLMLVPLLCLHGFQLPSDLEDDGNMRPYIYKLSLL